MSDPKHTRNSVKTLLGLIRDHPLATFFVLAYLGSWLVWSPWWLSRSGLGVLAYDLPTGAHLGINQLGLFAGPFMAALLVIRITSGKSGYRQFLRRLIQWRALPRWYILALIGIPVAVGVGYLLAPNAVIMPEGGIITIGMLLITYLVYLLGGPVQEEPGWRGFALPRMQQRFHPMTAALALGLIHCFWHTPLFFTREWDTARNSPDQFIAYLLLVVSMSVVLSWLVNGAKGSILLAILGHNGVNWALLAAGTFTGHAIIDTWPAALGMTALALIALFITRGNLGYKPSKASPIRRPQISS